MAWLVTRIAISPREAWDTPLRDVMAIAEALNPETEAAMIDLGMFGI